MFIADKSKYMLLFHLVFTGTQLKLLLEAFLNKEGKVKGSKVLPMSWVVSIQRNMSGTVHTPYLSLYNQAKNSLLFQ